MKITKDLLLRILVFVDYYLPGYKAGGPIRTLANMVDILGQEFQFLVVTRDRDAGSDLPFPDVQVDQWNQVGLARVFYSSPKTLSLVGIKRLLNGTPHDVLYLNSFLSPRATGLPLLLRRLGLYGNKPVILAPRGEFSPGALALKAQKKRLYIKLANALGLYQNLIWQASSTREMEEIRTAVWGGAKNVNNIVKVAPDLLVAPTKLETVRTEQNTAAQRPPGPLRMVFFSRISQKKNLDYLLRALQNVSGCCKLTIIGPREDLAYWAQCEKLIETLPTPIKVRYAGEITPDQVADAFAAHDLFVFPTWGENFGHVIFESLAAGTPVLTSDQTPWAADAQGAIEVLPLVSMRAWSQALQRWLAFDAKTLQHRRAVALRYAANYLQNSEALQQNRNLFRTAYERGIPQT